MLEHRIFHLHRFDPHLTNGQGPYWLKNLYFVYLLELRALTKAATYLEENAFYTGDDAEDKASILQNSCFSRKVLGYIFILHMWRKFHPKINDVNFNCW
jgi:hypothetical protein